MATRSPSPDALADALALTLRDLRAPDPLTAETVQAFTARVDRLASSLPGARQRGRYDVAAHGRVVNRLVPDLERVIQEGMGLVRQIMTPPQPSPFRDAAQLSALRQGLTTLRPALTKIHSWTNDAFEPALDSVSAALLRPPALVTLTSPGPERPSYSVEHRRARWAERLASLPGAEAADLALEILEALPPDRVASTLPRLSILSAGAVELQLRLVARLPEASLPVVARAVFRLRSVPDSVRAALGARVMAVLQALAVPPLPDAWRPWEFLTDRSLRLALPEAVRTHLLDISRGDGVDASVAIGALRVLVTTPSCAADDIRRLLEHPLLQARVRGAAKGRPPGDLPGMPALVESLLQHPLLPRPASEHLLACWRDLGLHAERAATLLTTHRPELLLDPRFADMRPGVAWATLLETALGRPGAQTPRALWDAMLTGTVDREGAAGLLGILDAVPEASRASAFSVLPWDTVLQHERVRRSTVRFRLHGFLARAGQGDALPAPLHPVALMHDRIRRIRSGTTAVALLDELMVGRGALFQQLDGAMVLRLVQLAALSAPNWDLARWAKSGALHAVRLAGESVPGHMPLLLRHLLRPHFALSAAQQEMLAKEMHQQRLGYGARLDVTGVLAWLLRVLRERPYTVRDLGQSSEAVAQAVRGLVAPRPARAAPADASDPTAPTPPQETLPDVLPEQRRVARV